MEVGHEAVIFDHLLWMLMGRHYTAFFSLGGRFLLWPNPSDAGGVPQLARHDAEMGRELALEVAGVLEPIDQPISATVIVEVIRSRRRAAPASCT